MSSTIENAIKSAVERFGEPLSDDEYQQWRQNVESNPPTKLAILRQTGVVSWEEACDVVGVDGIISSDNVQYSVTAAKSAMLEAAKHSDYMATTGQLTKSAYREYHEDSNSGTLPDHIPATSTVSKILGDKSWQSACNRVGVPPHDNDTLWDEDAIKRVVQQAADECDGELTKEKYNQWRETKSEEIRSAIPTANTVIDRLIDDLWQQARDTVFSESDTSVNSELDR